MILISLLSPDHLLSNPWAQPPLPCDWEIRPTHTRHDPLPYFLASLWDAEQAERKTTELKKEKTKKNDQFRSDGNHATEAARQRIPKLVRDRLKRARAAKGLLMDLEEQVRKFAKEWKATEVAGDHEAVLNRAEFHDFDFLSSEEEEEEEIVFVGRGGSMHDRPMSREGEGLRVRGLVPEKLVFDSLASDHGASFGYVNFSAPPFFFCFFLMLYASYGYTWAHFFHVLYSPPIAINSVSLHLLTFHFIVPPSSE